MTAEIISHDFGRKLPPEGDKEGEFPACLKREPPWEPGSCDHRRGPFSLLEAEGMAQCACGEKVTLVHVFKLLSTAENQLRQRFDYQRALVDSFSDRSRVKCDHCGKFTNLKPK